MINCLTQAVWNFARARCGVVAMTLIVAIAAAVWFATISRYQLLHFDAFDYAQMGHQIRLGEGFTTLVLYPRHIPWLSNRGFLAGASSPNLYRYPLTPIIDAAFEVGVGDAERAALIQSGTWFLVTVPLIYMLARIFAGPSWAVLSALLFVSQSISWGTSHDGLTESLAALLILLVYLLAFARNESAWRPFALGIMCGLAFLCRTQLIFLLPLSVAILFFTETEPRRVLKSSFLALVGSALAVGPWFLRNLSVAGSPTFSFSNTRNLAFYAAKGTDIELDVHAPIDAVSIFQVHRDAILHKIGTNLWPNIVNPFALTSNYAFAILLCLSLLALFVWRAQNRDKSKYRAALFIAATFSAVLANFVISSLLRVDPRFDIPLDPLLIVAGVLGVRIVLGAIARHGTRALAVVTNIAVALCALLFFHRLSQELGTAPPSSSDRQTYASFARSADFAGAVASDESDKIALFGHMRAIQLPSDPNQIFEINDRYLPVRYVVISAHLLGRTINEADRAVGYDHYRTFVKSPQFEMTYRFVRRLANGAEVYQERSPRPWSNGTGASDRSTCCSTS